MMKEENHVFQGMRRDNHQIRLDAKFLWDAHNIRFTARDDDTLLSITNERGTKDTGISLTGLYVGHCIVGDYLIIFTKSALFNAIYRISNTSNGWLGTRIYSGDLNMNPDNPALTLGIYEGENVLKVYWVDSVNLPRVINVVADKLLYQKDITELTDEEESNLYPEGCFDFVQELQLNETVTINREEGGGVFSPGTILYAFSYYNKYGQESNLFYTTELLYTSFPERGASPEDTTSNTFNITINNPETKFQYVRIYSIHRTSIDATPTVKLVADLEINGASTLTYVDRGTTGSIVDPTKMLYIGGESIIAGTLTEKDNTLFLGNITLNREAIPESVKKKLLLPLDVGSNLNVGVSCTTRTIELKAREDSNALYEYNNQLVTRNPSTFKVGDTYRIGLQFQHKSGKWSEPVYVQDCTIDSTRPYKNGDNVVVPALSITIKNNDIILALRESGYLKVRPLVVLPSIYDRMVLAQGVLCPTVFSIKDRISNTPFALSSWFFRPMSTYKLANDSEVIKGAAISFTHLSSLLSGKDRGAEILNMEGMTFELANNAAPTKGSDINTFFVDLSIVTLHSPDIEFNDGVKQALDGNEFELSIVGVAPIKSVAGDISIKTSSPVPAPNDTGFFHKSTLSTDYSNRGLVSGLFYRSHPIDDYTTKSDGVTKLRPFNIDDNTWQYNWLIYPWHRTGSLNNDINRDSDQGTRSSVLQRKVISNLRFSPDTIWFNNTWSSDRGDLAAGITPVSIFNSNEVSLIKIPVPKNSGISTLNYYGNVDTLITASKNYNFYVSKGEEEKDNFASEMFTLGQTSLDGVTFGNYTTQLKLVKDPVRMKYKSSPHAVFAFNYLKNTSAVILPKIHLEDGSYLNKYSDKDEAEDPFWSSNESESYVKVEYNEVKTTGFDPKDVVSVMISVLLSTYPRAAYGTLALGISSISPGSDKYADLYMAIGDGKWEKAVLREAGKIYYCTADKTYWRVKAYPGNKELEKLDNYIGAQYTIQQDTIEEENISQPCLFMAELKRKQKPDNMFGGTSEEALRNNLWIPAGKPVQLNGDTVTVYCTLGDTYYQRYDCLKTYSFTNEDENSVIEIASFMCETRVNIDGRYDRNRGQLSNLLVSPTIFNLLNPVYSLTDNFFNYRILDKLYYRNNLYPTLILWSLLKSYLEDVDTWTNITLASSLELNGNKGPITSLVTFNGSILAFQEKALNLVLFNDRVLIPVSDGVPVEITNGYKVNGARVISDTIGCQSKWSITKSPIGIYFVDNYTDSLYLYGEQIKNLSTELGNSWWMKQNHQDDGFLRLSYDPKNKDVYVSSDKEALCFSELIGLFTSIMDYGGTIMFPMKDKFLSLQLTPNKTINLWENFMGNYNQFYGEYKGWGISFVANDNPTYTKVFDTVELITDHYELNITGYLLLDSCPINYIKVSNEYLAGEASVDNKNMRKKFRVWRGLIPRNKGTRQRIRNPWAMITLGWDKPDISIESNNKKAIIHNVSVKYSI